MKSPSRAHRIEIVLDSLDAFSDAAAVGFELGFARTARADATAQTRHLHAMPAEARQDVVQLRQFHLQAAFPSVRARSKNVENQLRAVDDFAADGFFEVALLRREIG